LRRGENRVAIQFSGRFPTLNLRDDLRHKQRWKRALPGRLETLASFFNSMCLVDDPNGKLLLAEECYDDASVNSLEIANKCINATKEKSHAAKN
jgi:hypothetical protein